MHEVRHHSQQDYKQQNLHCAPVHHRGRGQLVCVNYFSKQLHNTSPQCTEIVNVDCCFFHQTHVLMVSMTVIRTLPVSLKLMAGIVVIVILVLRETDDNVLVRFTVSL